MEAFRRLQTDVDTSILVRDAETGESILQIAAKFSKHPDLIAMLFERGAAINDYAALFTAIEHGKKDALEKLIRTMLNRKDAAKVVDILRAEDGTVGVRIREPIDNKLAGDTVLQYAVKMDMARGSIDWSDSCTRLLADLAHKQVTGEAGFNNFDYLLFFAPEFSTPPLHLAIRAPQPTSWHCLRVLLPDTAGNSIDYNVNASDTYGRTALHAAVLTQDVHAVYIILMFNERAHSLKDKDKIITPGIYAEAERMEGGSSSESKQIAALLYLFRDLRGKHDMNLFLTNRLKDEHDIEAVQKILMLATVNVFDSPVVNVHHTDSIGTC